MLAMTMTRLRTASWTLAITQVDGATPIDLTNKVIWFFAKEHLNDPDNKAIIRKSSGSGIVTTDALGGLATLTVDPKDTTDLALKSAILLLCECVLVDGPNRYQLDAGTLTVLGNVSVPL